VPRKEKATIRLVAERAQVAISTVSRVVNGGRASAAARKRVQQAIRELDYSPSLAAQSLVTGRAGCIGLAVNSSQSPWFTQILSGIEEALGPARKSVLLASMMQSGRYDGSAVAGWIQAARVDGLIFVRYSRRNRPLLAAARRAGLPVVLIAPDLLAPADFVARCDNVQAGSLVAAHLAGLGHRRIAFAGGPEDSLDTRNRLEGLETGLAERGVALRPRDVWFAASYAPEAGIEYAARFAALRPAQRASAVVLGNDVMALGFMRSLLQRGLRVPEDVSIVGFDGIVEGGLCWPGLTTVVQPTRRMAASACRALLERVQHAERRGVMSAVDYGVELLVRESTTRPSGAR
jgi:LacI family transcriptional regulator